MSRRALAVATATALAAALALAAEAAERRESRELLIQPFLSPDYAQWMVGPIAWLATDDEIDAWMALRDDQRAEVFIEEFWQRKDAESELALREIYERRATEADDEFTEGHVPGRRTDRGTIYVLFGPPESSEYEELRYTTEPDVELWRYPKKAEPGLHGKKPKREYRFARQGDLTRFYEAPTRDELERRARGRRLRQR